MIIHRSCVISASPCKCIGHVVHYYSLVAETLTCAGRSNTESMGDMFCCSSGWKPGRSKNMASQKVLYACQQENTLDSQLAIIVFACFAAVIKHRGIPTNDGRSAGRRGQWQCASLFWGTAPWFCPSLFPPQCHPWLCIPLLRYIVLPNPLKMCQKTILLEVCLPGVTFSVLG